MRDEEMMGLLRSCPEEGIAAIQKEYGGRVRSMAARILGQTRRQDVEECVADIFVKLWQEAASYDAQKGSLLSWLYGISRHTAIDRLRRLAGKDTQPLPDFKEQEGLGIVPDFADEVAQRENAAVIRAAVHAMRQPDRNIFLLRYFYFLPVKEIARRLEMTDKQVENRLARGRKKLRRELTQKGVILE